jgi:uncharacterized membrane protein YeaQ/YmgE (transglycosylase-associated protein family)
MNIIVWLVVGGVLGWIASIIMKTDGQQGIGLNVVVGILGALIGGWIIAPMFASDTINQGDFSLSSLVASLIGAIFLLAVVNLVQRRQVR